MKKKKKDNLDIKSNKKHIFRKILLGLLVIVLLIFIISMISNFITNRKIDKFRDNISSIEKEKINYVFIEINPSLVLTMKDGKVSDVACLNDDCIEIYDEIDVKGKSIDESIDNLYNLSKEKGYDISNGVKVKTTDEIEVKKKDYISIEYIDNDTKNELLSNIKNNEEIKNNNDNYYANLWEELKKDEDYGVVYECNMNNKELECYIKKGFVIHNHDSNETNIIDEIINIWASDITPNLKRIERVLKKFNIDVKRDEELYFINHPIGVITINGVSYSNAIIEKTPEKFEYTGKIKCDYYIFNLVDINLLNPNNLKPRIELEDEDIDYNINPIIENSDDYFECSSKYCKKYTYKTTRTYTCDYSDGEYMWQEKHEDGTEYAICNANKSNCKKVSLEYYNNFDLTYGYLYDLPECEKVYGLDCEDGCYINNSKTNYCRTYENGNWSILFPIQ